MAEYITLKLIDGLDSPAQGNHIIYDSEIHGFGVRITNAGVKSFVLNYRIRGRERRYTIGRCQDWTVTAARREATKLRGDIAHGNDPLERKAQEYRQEEAERTRPTFYALTREYMEAHQPPALRAGTIRNNRSMLQAILLPRLADRPPAEIQRDDLERIHRSLKDTPYHANRVLALMSAIFKWASADPKRKEKFGVSDNPARGIPRYHEDKRETWLTEEQLENFERALDAYSEQDAADALRLLILTGSREGEVLSAEWSNFDLKRGTWTKPSHHTKQKKTEHVPLSQAALLVLKRMAKHRNGPYLFPGRQGNGSRVSLRRPWMQVCKAAGLAVEERKQGKRHQLVRYRPIIRLHDLRHTFASHLVSRGESLHIVGKLLGHTRSETTARYAHLSDESLRVAANRFGDIFQNGRKAH